MSDSKKYYYLKVKDNFYESEEMIILQNMPDGYLYSDILMKLYLRSLKNNGKLMFKDVIPYTPSALAQVVRHQVGTVEKALKIFQDLGLIEVLDNGAIYMLDIQNFIGKSSTEADRKRLYRAEIQKEVKMLGQMSDKTPPEIDIEIEKDVDNIYGQDELDQLGQKKETWEQQFEKFYRKYPKKVKKQDVKKWFIKNQPSDELFSFMMNKLEQFRGSADWQKDGGSYIPYPTTWLKQKRWEDEEIQKTQQNKLCNFGNQRDYGDMSFLYANQGGIINEK
mgnify:CR=1 FL=1